MNLFLVPASKENIEKTITDDVDISIAEKFLIPYAFKKLKDLLGAGSRFNCWAMTESNRAVFNKMQAGDIVLLATKGTGSFKYVAEVFYTTESEELGNYLWSYVPSSPWKLIYFLKNIKGINIDRSILVKELGYNPNYLVPGIIRVKDNFVCNILERYDSVQHFLDALSKEKYTKRIAEPINGENSIPKEQAYERPEWLLLIINDIEILKNDPEHKERAHESLVESFYEKLGFVKYVNIKHRQGRVDIGIEHNNQMIIVNEAKRDWHLSHNDKKVVREGYNYAYENGARYVVITNGDYYAVYDRDKGRSYETNFIGDFTLSKLNKENLKLIEILKNAAD